VPAGASLQAYLSAGAQGVPSADYDGIQQQNGASDNRGAMFESNTYHVANGATHLWHRWNGSRLVTVGLRDDAERLRAGTGWDVPQPVTCNARAHTEQ